MKREGRCDSIWGHRMGTHEHWTDRLSEYVDGDLSAAERVSCDEHLSRCGECAGALEEIRVIVAQASLLPGTIPDHDLWPGIENRLEPRSRHPADRVVPISWRRRISVTVPQLAAAAIALVLLTAGAARVLLSLPGDEEVRTAGVEATQGPQDAGQPVVFLAAYEPAISELEAAFAAGQADLDPETVRVVEQNLAIIDRAIVEANQALSEDPSSAFLTTHLAGAMRQKVDLLRRVTSIGKTES